MKSSERAFHSSATCAGRENRTPASTLGRSRPTTKPYPPSVRHSEPSARRSPLVREGDLLIILLHLKQTKSPAEIFRQSTSNQPKRKIFSTIRVLVVERLKITARVKMTREILISTVEIRIAMTAKITGTSVRIVEPRISRWLISGFLM